MIDYGTIHVFMQRGLTYDQAFSIVRINMDNQLLTSNRTHFNEILHQCTQVIKFMNEAPFKITWNLVEYRYVFRIDIVE
jgi:hypothetical protein